MKTVLALLVGAVTLSSCIGSFGLTNKLLDWNKGLSNKFVNELVFILISPAYAVCGLADLLVLNTGEFLTDSKGIAHVTLDHDLPIGFGLLTCDSIEQAIERAGSKGGNKGVEAAAAMLETIRVLEQL